MQEMNGYTMWSKQVRVWSSATVQAHLRVQMQMMRKRLHDTSHGAVPSIAEEGEQLDGGDGVGSTYSWFESMSNS